MESESGELTFNPDAMILNYAYQFEFDGGKFQVIKESDDLVVVYEIQP